MTTTTTTGPVPQTQGLTREDFVSSQEVRWCPGCGDYSILAQVQKVMPELGIPREKIVFVSGIGCSSRFPYYMNTYGFHGIHGRATAVATGVKCANPDLQVWVVTGDGDGLSIGGNHMLHTLRRNMDIKVLLFNNRIYGLTKGQTSPTSEHGKRTKSTPFGSIENPINPVSFAIAAEATFVARAIATETKHLAEVIGRAARHKGTAFVEIYQNCNIFNDGAFEEISAREVKADRLVMLEHGKPLVFGKQREKAIRMRHLHMEVGPANAADDGAQVVVHDEKSADSTLAYMLGNMRWPEYPEALGVFRAVEKPTYDGSLIDQIQAAQGGKGPGHLRDLIHSGERWRIK
jgi:2-oxoglutarate/2-oxoacid ferredoxin oxidoreductase subunit beta